MPSSTSNSETRCPQLPYTQIWVATVLLFVGMLCISELYWRNKGFLPTIVDTQVYWGEHRHHIYAENGRQKLVIVGSSRAQLGLDPITLNEAFPNYDVVHLAIDGALPFEVIKDLCTDPKFTGAILAEATVPFLCVTEPELKKKEMAYLSYYHETFQTGAALEKRLNTMLSANLQSHTVIASPALSFKELLYNRFKPNKLYYHMHPNRFRPAHYRTRLSEKALASHRAKRIQSLTQNALTQVPMQKFESLATVQLKSLYQQLQNRGGSMVLVRMPTTDEHWQIDERMAPKMHYWDRLEFLSGIPAIHFLDYDALKDYDCPDTSHLDASDAPNFTKALASVMRNKWHVQTPHSHQHGVQ